MQDIAGKEGEIRDREESVAKAAEQHAAQRARRDDLLNQQRYLFQQDSELEG